MIIYLPHKIIFPCYLRHPKDMTQPIFRATETHPHSRKFLLTDVHNQANYYVRDEAKLRNDLEFGNLALCTVEGTPIILGVSLSYGEEAMTDENSFPTTLPDNENLPHIYWGSLKGTRVKCKRLFKQLHSFEPFFIGDVYLVEDVSKVDTQGQPLILMKNLSTSTNHQLLSKEELVDNFVSLQELPISLTEY